MRAGAEGCQPTCPSPCTATVTPSRSSRPSRQATADFSPVKTPRAVIGDGSPRPPRSGARPTTWAVSSATSAIVVGAGAHVPLRRCSGRRAGSTAWPSARKSAPRSAIGALGGEDHRLAAAQRQIGDRGLVRSCRATGAGRLGQLPRRRDSATSGTRRAPGPGRCRGSPGIACNPLSGSAAKTTCSWPSKSSRSKTAIASPRCSMPSGSANKAPGRRTHDPTAGRQSTTGFCTATIVAAFFFCDFYRLLGLIMKAVNTGFDASLTKTRSVFGPVRTHRRWQTLRFEHNISEGAHAKKSEGREEVFASAAVAALVRFGPGGVSQGIRRFRLPTPTETPARWPRRTASSSTPIRPG